MHVVRNQGFNDDAATLKSIQVTIKGRPGLVVTRARCYSCVFSKTGRQQEFSVMSYEKYIKPCKSAC